MVSSIELKKMEESSLVTVLKKCNDDQSRGQVAIASRNQFKKISFLELMHICDLFNTPVWKILMLDQYHHLLIPDVTPQNLQIFLSSIPSIYHECIKESLKDKYVSWFDEPSTPEYLPYDEIDLPASEGDFSHFESSQNDDKNSEDGAILSCKICLFFTIIMPAILLYLLFW